MDSHDTQSVERFLLWIDSVGGYWVCRGETITIGQPNDRDTVDVPILGDLSSRHARLRRDDESYLVEALREVTVDGQPVHEFGWLHDGSEIRLGQAVRLAFHHPNALSGTVRLDFVSRHRTQPTTDAVLWMADACILGPKPSSHVVCRKWTREVILYRNQTELFCRTPGTFTVDGTRCQDRGRITTSSHIEGEGFRFHLEPIGVSGRVP